MGCCAAPGTAMTIARSTASEELDDAMAEAIAYRGPAMIEVMADPDLV
jgi:thiamine pyrophosphate-dependent acetolactate synthase large subunit-like protein